MFKRILLTLTFAAAFGAGGLCLTDTADAWRLGWVRPYAAYSYGPRVYYNSGVPYTYYPRRAYYNPYVAPNYYYYGPRVGVRVGPLWR